MAVALVLADHSSHDRVVEALDGRVLGLAGHACFETYSVLTRLPTPGRRGASEVRRLLLENFPETRFIDERSQRGLVERLADLGLSGGSVYDALVGESARLHKFRLATRDKRAVPVYRALEVEFEFLN